MSHNLNLLRQNYCTPATVTGKISHDLFPLEKECDEGKALLAKAPAPLLDVQEFDPSGLEQTYRDEVTGAELPVFAVFNLEGKKRCTFEITTELLRIAGEPNGLQAKIPFNKSQAFVKQINERRTKIERAIGAIAGILGILPALAYLLSRLTGTAGATAPLHFLKGGRSERCCYTLWVFTCWSDFARGRSWSSPRNLTVSCREKPGKKREQLETTLIVFTSSSTNSTVGKANFYQIQRRGPWTRCLLARLGRRVNPNFL